MPEYVAKYEAAVAEYDQAVKTDQVKMDTKSVLYLACLFIVHCFLPKQEIVKTETGPGFEGDDFNSPLTIKNLAGDIKQKPKKPRKTFKWSPKLK